MNEYWRERDESIGLDHAVCKWCNRKDGDTSAMASPLRENIRIGDIRGIDI